MIELFYHNSLHLSPLYVTMRVCVQACDVHVHACDVHVMYMYMHVMCMCVCV